jgi:hypothetical protein
MPYAIINRRKVLLPSSTTSERIREVGGIAPGRNLVRRTREGNYLVPLGAEVEVDEGDRFIDAPARVKGRRNWR